MLRFAPLIECGSQVAVSSAVEIVSAAVVRSNLRRAYVVWNETTRGVADAPYSWPCSRFMTGTLMSTVDCGAVVLGTTSDSDSSSESSESLSESCRVVASQPVRHELTR